MIPSTDIQIKVKDSAGNIKFENIESSKLRQALDAHNRNGNTILKIRNRTTFTQKKQKTKLDIYIFAKELLILLDAGLNINEAMQAFILKEANPLLKSVFLGIAESLKQGKKLSQAFANYSQFFPKIFISAVQSSETSGNIKQSLKRFITYQAQERLLKSQIKSASIYPILLSVMGTLVTLFLLGYVVPRFSTIYDSSGRDIPVLSRILLTFGNWLSHHQFLVVFCLIGTLLCLLKLFRNPKFQALLVQKLLHNAYFKEIFQEYYLSKFYRVMGLLLDSGMPLLEAIGLAQTLLHSYYNQKIMLLKQQVNSGVRLSEAFWANDLAPPVAFSMLKVGESAGDIAKMFDSSADFYEEKLTFHIQFLMKVIEPLLMIAIGLIIGLVIVLLYLPIFDLAGSVSS